MILSKTVFLPFVFFLPSSGAASFVSRPNHRTGRLQKHHHPLPKRCGFGKAKIISQQQSVSKLGYFNYVDSIPDGLLWGLRFGSAILSYVGFLTYFDRPRGELNVKLDQQVEVKQSLVPGAGLGLFAKESLPKGQVLGTYPGAVVPLSQNLPKLRDFPACEGYIWRFSDNRFVIDPTNARGVLESTCPGGNPSMPGSMTLFDSVLRPAFSISSALCRINEPPRGMDVNVVTSERIQDRSVTFLLERDVMAGEEFFIDYGLSYDRSMYGGADPKNTEVS